jgi:hypothetical protein
MSLASTPRLESPGPHQDWDWLLRPAERDLR